MGLYKTLGLLILTFSFLGCTPNIKETTKNNANNINSDNSEDVISLSISSLSSVKENSDLNESINELNELIITNIQKKLPNIAVISNQSKNGLEVDITIEKFRYVSGFGRFMAGVMVGDAILKLNMKIKNIKTGVLITETTLDTTSEFGNGIFGATTSRQIEAMSEKITEYIKKAKNS